MGWGGKSSFTPTKRGSVTSFYHAGGGGGGHNELQMTLKGTQHAVQWS